jgi:hypothetical protein
MATLGFSAAGGRWMPLPMEARPTASSLPGVAAASLGAFFPGTL